MSETLISPVAGVLTAGLIPAPVRFASNDRPNDGVGLADGEGLAVPLGDGEGVPVGEPLGDGDGDGVPKAELNEPLRMVLEPFLTAIGIPDVTAGTNWPSSLRRRNRPSPPLSTNMVPTLLPFITTPSAVPMGRFTWRMRTSSSVRLL